MATTRLISMHQNKGKSIADCLADRTDYAKILRKQTRVNTLALMSATPKPYKVNFSFQSGSILILRAGSKKMM